MKDNMIKLFSILFLSLFFAPVFAQAARQFLEVRYSSGNHIQVKYGDYLRSIERRAARMIRSSGEPLNLKFRVVADFPEGFKADKNPDSYLLSDNLERLYYDYDLNIKMIEVMLLARCGYRPDQLKEPYPRWVLTALYGKLHPSQGHIMPLTRRPGLYALAVAGESPDFETTLLTPMIFTRDGPAAYFFYEEICVLVLDTVDSPSAEAGDFYRMAELCVAGGKTQAEIMAQTVRKTIAGKVGDTGQTDAEKMQSYLENSSRSLVSVFMPLNSVQSQKYVREIATFKYKISQGGQLVERQAALEQLPFLLETMADREEVIKTLTDRMTELGNKSFYQVSDETKNLVQVLKDAGLGTVASPRTLSERIRRSLNNMNLALERQYKIEERLKALERAHVKPADYYSREFSELQSIPKPFPEVEQLLDKYEKELRDFH